MDKYPSFKELKRYETEFSIELCDQGSDVTVLAPHGGRIEPHTEEITKLIAGEDYNYFCFNGMKQGNNRDLHITSHRYDEEQALVLVQKSTTVITIHGCTRKDPMIFLGGLDGNLKEKISSALTTMKIPVSHSWPNCTGTNMNNICNRGITGKGVQLEISRALRDSPASRSAIAKAVRSSLSA